MAAGGHMRFEEWLETYSKGAPSDMTANADAIALAHAAWDAGYHYGQEDYVIAENNLQRMIEGRRRFTA
jgi:hypothetical protein